jgi:hypothetical protein
MGKKNKGKRDPEKIEEARALFEEAIKDTQKMELTLMELLVTRDYKKHILDHEGKTDEGAAMLGEVMKKAEGPVSALEDLLKKTDKPLLQRDYAKK